MSVKESFKLLKNLLVRQISLHITAESFEKVFRVIRVIVIILFTFFDLFFRFERTNNYYLGFPSWSICIVRWWYAREFTVFFYKRWVLDYFVFLIILRLWWRSFTEFLIAILAVIFTLIVTTCHVELILSTVAVAILLVWRETLVIRYSVVIFYHRITLGGRLVHK